MTLVILLQQDLEFLICLQFECEHKPPEKMVLHHDFGQSNCFQKTNLLIKNSFTLTRAESQLNKELALPISGFDKLIAIKKVFTFEMGKNIACSSCDLALRKPKSNFFHQSCPSLFAMQAMIFLDSN